MIWKICRVWQPAVGRYMHSCQTWYHLFVYDCTYRQPYMELNCGRGTTISSCDLSPVILKFTDWIRSVFDTFVIFKGLCWMYVYSHHSLDDEALWFWPILYYNSIENWDSRHYNFDTMNSEIMFNLFQISYKFISLLEPPRITKQMIIMILWSVDNDPLVIIQSFIAVCSWMNSASSRIVCLRKQELFYDLNDYESWRAVLCGFYLMILAILMLTI